MKHRFSSTLGSGLVVLALLSAFVPMAMGQANVQGQWTTLPYTITINPIHAALLHNNKILVVTGSGNCPPGQSGCPSGAPYGPSNGSGAVLLDLVAGTITPFTVTYDMFCNGMINLPDGRALINGGTINYSPLSGSVQSNIFDPATNTFSYIQNMAHGRWYPTVTTLGDGRVMTFSGYNENGEITNPTIEIYTLNSGWSPQYTPDWTPPLYPRMTVMPSGNVFYSGETNVTQMFNPSNQTWTFVANTYYGLDREYGSSVLLPLTPANNYDPRMIILGGGNPGSATTELIDLGAAKPTWTPGPKMSEARIEMNATLLPSGKVLALGGSVNDEDASTASYNADLYDPATNTFSSAGKNAYPRLYHSVSLLLPDATVWFAGGNPERGDYEPHMEIYQPAYLFNSDGTLATRPTITSAPTGASYGNSFSVQTPDAASIASVVLMRDGAVTHSFDMDQRQVGLLFTVSSDGLTVTAPPNSNIAPPGFYMLFLLNTAGVPSVASFIQLSTGYSTTGINFVQANTGPGSVQSSNSSVSINYVNPQTAGNLNIVAVGWADTTSAITSLADTNGNTYTRAVGPTANTGQQQVIYYAKNIAAGSNTVTVTFNKAAAYPDLRILEYNGLDTINPLDVTAGAAGSGTEASSGSATTTSANELIFGAGTTAGGFSAPGSGFATRILNVFGNMAEDETVSSTGSYAATATNSGGNWLMQMATFKARVAIADFSIQASPSSAPVDTGGSVNYTVTVSALNGFNSAVTLACSGLPSGVSCAFNPPSVTPNSNPATSTLTISAASGTAPNTYNVTITGTSGSLSHNTSVSLIVQTAIGADFSISAASPVIVSAGASVASTVSISPANGFNAAVDLTCSSGLPSGAACSFSPASVAGSGNSTLNITTAPATPAGSYPVTVTGTSGSLIHTATVTLTVIAGGSFSLSTPSPDTGTVTPGNSATFATTVTPSGGFAGTVTLTCVIATSASPPPACPSTQVTVNGAGSPATLSVTTTAPHLSLVPSHRNMFYAMLLPLGGMMLVGASGCARRKKVFGLLLMCLLVSGLLFLTACGGGSSSNNGGAMTGGTPAGTYSVTVTGTSGSLPAQTTTFTLTVQ